MYAKLFMQMKYSKLTCLHIDFKYLTYDLHIDFKYLTYDLHLDSTYLIYDLHIDF